MKRSKTGRQLAVVRSLVSKLEPISSARIGWVAGVSPAGRPLVDYHGSREGPFEAASTVAISREEFESAAATRQAVVLLFDGGEPGSPIIMGFLVPELPSEGRADAPRPETAEVDGRRVCIDGTDEVALRCGEASITLRRDGKVVIRGMYVESHSKGTNRIKGGAVLIN